MRVQRTGRCDSDRLHFPRLPHRFNGFDEAIEYTSLSPMRTRAMMIERDDIIRFIRGGTNMCPANVYGYNEAHITHYNRPPSSFSQIRLKFSSRIWRRCPTLAPD